MAKHANITGAPLTAGRAAVSIVHADPVESPLTTPADIPTSVLGAPQISHTLLAADMPTWSPYPLPHRAAAIQYVAGSNPGSSDSIVYYLFKKGSAYAASGAINLPAGKSFTISAMCYPDVAAGDELTCSLWSDASGAAYDYSAAVVYATAVCAGARPAQHVVIEHLDPPVLSSGTPAVASAVAPMMPAAGGDAEAFARYVSGSMVPLVSAHPDYGIACAEYGDVYRGCIVTFHDTARPYYYANRRISRIEYTATVLRV